MSKTRFISDIQSAEPCDRPACIPKSRPRGRKAAGLKYERDLACGLRLAITGYFPLWHGQWFKFVDKNGPGYCQPDILLQTSLGIVILESKYTWTEAGHLQIERLYAPVIEKAYPGVQSFGIVVCKVLTRDVKLEWICRDLNSAIVRAASGRKTVLHWIGAGLAPFAIPS